MQTEGKVLRLVDLTLVVETDVGSQRVGGMRRGVLAAAADDGAVGEVAAYEAAAGTQRQLVGDLQRIGQVKGELVGVYGLQRLAILVGVVDVAERKIGEACGSGAVFVDTVVSAQIEQVHVADLKVAKPRGVREPHTHIAVNESQLGVVPVGRIEVGRRGGTHVAHTAAHSIGGDKQYRHTGGYVVLVVDVLSCPVCAGAALSHCRGSKRDKYGCYCQSFHVFCRLYLLITSVVCFYCVNAL